MEWYYAVLIIMVGSLFLMMLGVPVAFALLAVDIIGVFLWWGGVPGLMRLTASIRDGVGTFILIPIPLFVLMGEIMYHADIIPQLIDSLDKWIGRLPGRLSLLTVVTGTILGTLTGVTMSSVALLGSTVVPEMEKRGYKKSMVLGPAGSIGILAAMIPPTVLGVLIAGLAQVSIGKVLVGIVIIIRCWIQPHIAPPYETAKSTLSEKLISFVYYVMPVGIVIFFVVGLIFLGVATPSEAAAGGVVGTLIMAAIYKKLRWQVIKKALWGSLKISVMVLIVISAARAFGQVLAFSGANSAMVGFATTANIPPMIVLVLMQVLVLILGCIMDVVAIAMILVPVFMPIVKALAVNEVWFVVILILSATIGAVSPPFGLDLFALKGTVGSRYTLNDIYKAVVPFVILDVVALALVMIFPDLALWLPNLVRR
jgi:tripartite ATP-independent transporter DctM subunit